MVERTKLTIDNIAAAKELVNQKQVDPALLFNELNSIAAQVKRESVYSKLSRMPEPQTADDYFDQAIDLIKQDAYGSRRFGITVGDYLTKAEEIAKESGSEKRVVYKWVRENLDVYYEIQKRHWWANY
ncbi:hypothetical protein HY404_03385 [Candidatus Microgenomates bacterium]|nr:hypothetical protein [Candidatus Microgenomates bacterium]